MQNFSKLKNQAIEQMRKMNQRASKDCENTQSQPSFQAKKQNKSHKILEKNILNIPSNDDLIIIGILLILGEDCRDIWLFLALLYILM